MFSRMKLERKQLEKKRHELEQCQKSPVSNADWAKELVQRFVETVWESRELLVSLIERVELTADKEILIKFRFAQLTEVTENQPSQASTSPQTANFSEKNHLH